MRRIDSRLERIEVNFFGRQRDWTSQTEIEQSRVKNLVTGLSRFGFDLNSQDFGDNLKHHFQLRGNLKAVELLGAFDQDERNNLLLEATTVNPSISEP